MKDSRHRKIPFEQLNGLLMLFGAVSLDEQVRVISRRMDLKKDEIVEIVFPEEELDEFVKSAQFWASSLGCFMKQSRRDGYTIAIEPNQAVILSLKISPEYKDYLFAR